MTRSSTSRGTNEPLPDPIPPPPISLEPNVDNMQNNDVTEPMETESTNPPLQPPPISTTTTPKVVPEKKPAKKKIVRKPRPFKVQPSISAHLQTYDVITDLQQQKANITYGQLIQLSPQVRSDLARGIRKPTMRSAKFMDQPNNRTPTALYCDASINGVEVPLILDSGAAGSIVSRQLLNNLGMHIERPSTSVMINVNDERKRPLGEVTNFPVTIKGATIPVDAVVVEADSYGLIVGNDWFLKAKAKVDWETLTLIFKWDGKSFEVPVECRMLPAARREMLKDQAYEEVDDDEEDSDDEEYEEEDLEERAFFFFKFETGSEAQEPNITPALELTCRFDDVITEGIGLHKNVVCVNEGVYLGRNFYHWSFFESLNERFSTKPPPKATWVYDWKGPKSRCWCDEPLYSPSNQCSRCYSDLRDYLSIKTIEPAIIKELSIGPFDDWGPPDEARQIEDLTIQPTDQLILFKDMITGELNKCTFCSHQRHLPTIKVPHDDVSISHDLNRYLLAELENGENFESPLVTNRGSLTTEQHLALDSLFEEYADLFASNYSQMGKTELVQHQISVGNATPIKQRWYSNTYHGHQVIQKEIANMLELGIIEKSFGPWSSPVVLVGKPDGTWRFCVDYRKLNSVTKKDVYPLPRINDILDALQGACFFTSLDLFSGYWQIAMSPEDREKTAFITKFGTFQFKVMPFGLCNAPATFQRLMDQVLDDYLWRFVVVYLDDLNIFSKTFDEHLNHLRMVFDRLKSAGLKLKPSKCSFVRKELYFLGYKVSDQGIQTDPRKIEKVKNYPVPKNVTQIRQFLGLASYYRRFIRDFSKIAAPLNWLLRKDQKFHWTPKQQEAFETLKKHLISAPILAYPDFSREFKLYTDASSFGLGAILSQVDDNKLEHVIYYGSRSLSSAEKNYTTTERECLAIVWAVKYFSQYLIGKKFTLITDHQALCHLFNTVTPSDRLARWVMKLQSFDFKVIHRAGKQHKNVDSLSRLH